MANSLTTKPIILDTVGATSAVTDKQNLHSIVVKPTAVNWVCLINTESGGDVILDVFGAAKESAQFFFPENFPAKSLYATTLTNCSVQVFVK